jgi:very-short-patch-repair endonuclease
MVRKPPSYDRSFASNEERAACWHITKNGVVKPRDVFKSSGKKYWFTCDNGHDFDTQLNNVTNNRNWCPSCHQKPSYEQSFASNEERAACWHATKNGKVKPRDVFKSAPNKKYWFTCDNNHDFDIRLNDVTGGHWCSSCHQTPSYEQSFASNEKRVACWHITKNGDVKPRDVFKSSRKKYWFTCDNGHDFDIRLNHVTGGNWCPSCHQTPPYERSFASNEERAACWHTTKNGDVKPWDVFKSARKKYWFTCDNGHDFDMSLSNVTNGKWCSSCVNKTETHVFETLRDKGYDVGKKSNRKMFKTKYRYDIIIDDKKVIVEVDGAQHFKQVSNWCSYEETYKTDIYKEELAHKNGYRVVRISQEYVWYRQIAKNKTEWISKLVKAIESEYENQFISDTDEYIHRSVITNQIPF